MYCGPGPPCYVLGLMLGLFLPLCLTTPVLPSDLCQQTIWDNTLEPKHVHETLLTCSEGHVTWERPYGAIRVTLAIPSRHPIEACFKATSYSTVVKISLEEDSQSTVLGSQNEIGQKMSHYSNDNLRPLLRLNESSQSSREVCVRNDLGSVTLYVEALSDLDAMLAGKVFLEYDIRRVQAKSTDEMEECRPCTDEELLQSVCSSDYVIVGAMGSVIHHPNLEETEIRMQAHRVLRQMHQQDALHAPLKCGISRGEGQFLFTARRRLGRALLQCAPRYTYVMSLWNKAVQQQSNPCFIDGL